MTPADDARARTPSHATMPGSSAVPGALHVELDQGSILTVDRGYVIGRDPVAPPSHPDATPVPVADHDRSVTKTHLFLGPGRDGLEVIDLHSTNGVVVSEPGRPRRWLEPAVPTIVVVGTLVEYGDRTIVVRP